MSIGFLRDVVDVDAPVEQVWSYAVDWRRQGEWIPLTRVWPVAEGVGVGARVDAWTGIGRLGFVDTMTITAWDPPRRCEVLHTGRVVRGEGGFVVTSRGVSRSSFEWWERLTLPMGSVGALAWPAARPAYATVVRRSLRALKQAVES